MSHVGVPWALAISPAAVGDKLDPRPSEELTGVQAIPEELKHTGEFRVGDAEVEHGVGALGGGLGSVGPVDSEGDDTNSEHHLGASEVDPAASPGLAGGVDGVEVDEPGKRGDPDEHVAETTRDDSKGEEERGGGADEVDALGAEDPGDDSDAGDAGEHVARAAGRKSCVRRAERHAGEHPGSEAQLL